MAIPVTIDGLNLLTDLYLQENLLSMLPDTIGEGGRGEVGWRGGSGRGRSGRGGRREKGGEITVFVAFCKGQGDGGEEKRESSLLTITDPSFAGELSKLGILRLDNNRLTSLPNTFGG